MSVKVRLHHYFNDFTNGQEVVESNAQTIKELIDDLEAKFPGIKEHLVDKRGRLQGFIELFVNAEVVYPENTNVPIKDGDLIEILMIVAGG